MSNNLVPTSHNRHTGRLLAHHHTSYAALVLVVLLAGLLLAAITLISFQQTRAVTSSGDINLSGTVPGPPPDVAPTILQPSNGQHFQSSPIQVSGNCKAGLVVVIYRNNTVAGSVVCADNGTFSLKIDLFLGRNDLQAKQFDSLNQASPASAIVTVYLDQKVVSQIIAGKTTPGPATPPAPPFLVRTDYRYQGIFPAISFSLPVEVVGGLAPYAISIDWGDGSSSLLSRSTAGRFKYDHSYAKPGNYSVTIKASDAAGSNALFQTVIIVNGPINSGSNLPGTSRLLIAWPLYILMATLLIGFGLGDRYEYFHLTHQG